MSIDFYKEFGELGYLANYSDHGFFEDGIFYKTVEHYYQAHKFDNKELFNKIINAKTPKEASTIGRDRNNKRKDNFDKLKVMYQGLYLKFKNHKDLRTKLIETRNQEIREMTVKESYWGIGPNLDGENHIGKLLMEVREQLKKELLEEIINKCKDKKVYILGHRNPDVDSVFSSYLLSKILKSYGIDAVFSVRDEHFLEREIQEDYLQEDYEVVEDYNDKYFILVDHNNIDGIPQENILGAIDHHRITGEVEDLIEIEYASTGLLIYDLFKDKYQFTKQDKDLIALTTILDTEFLLSARFSEEDKKLYEELNVNIDPLVIRNKYLKTTNFKTDMNTVLHEDYKEYNYKNNKIKRSIIRSFSKDTKKLIDSFTIEMNNHDVNLIIWCDYEEEATYICFNNEIIKHPFFTTSTNLVLDYLLKEGKIIPINETYYKKHI